MSHRLATGLKRWRTWVPAICLLAIAVGGPAAGMASRQSRTAAPRRPGSTHSNAVSKASADPSGVFRRSVERAIQKQAAHRAWLRTPSVRQARRRSRRAYRGLNRHAAVLLARQQFRSQLKPLPPHLVQAPSGGKILSYINDHAVRVSTANRQRAVAISSLPLRDATASGGTAPVNLTLKTRDRASSRPTRSCQ